MTAERLLTLMQVRLPAKVHYAVRAAAVGAVLVTSTFSLAGRVGAAEREPAPEAVVISADTPVVTGISAKAVEVKAEPQVLTIVGTAFVNGMTARLISPLEETTSTFPASALEQVTPTSFQLRAILDEIGTYELTVRTPNGQRSNPLQVQVKRAAPVKTVKR